MTPEPLKTRSRHVPLRRCTSCRRRGPQLELLRFYQKDGVWRFDAARRAGGRGSWLCADAASCWEVKRLRRTFRAQADEIHALLHALAPRSERTPHLTQLPNPRQPQK